MLDERRIAIIIPAFNEAERIVSTINRIGQFVKRKFRFYEIVIVSDGSTDDTNIIVASLCDSLPNVKLIKQPVNIGKGASIKKGISATSADLILTCDADLSTPIEEFDKLDSWLQKGFDVVIGSRGLKGSEIVLRQQWFRERMGKIFNVFVQILVIRGIKDTQCGFKLFKGDVARKIYGKTRINRFSSDVEALFLSNKLGYSIKDVPIRWIDSPYSKVRLFADSANMFVDLFKIRLHDVFGGY